MDVKRKLVFRINISIIIQSHKYNKKKKHIKKWYGRIILLWLNRIALSSNAIEADA